MRKNVTLHIAATAVALLSTITLALASPPKQIDIPPGDLATALEAISKQADVELVFQLEQVRGLRTRGVSGLLSSQEAVKKLLEGTALQLRTDEGTGAMMIGRVEALSPGRSTAGTRVGSVFRLAQASSSPPSGKDVRRADEESTTNPENPEGQQDRAALEQHDHQVEEVVVTGTHIRGMTPEALPLTIYDRDYIEKSGVATVEQLARQIPQNFASTDSATYGHSLGGLGGGISQTGHAYPGQSGLNIHGLGPSSTLVLLNGHRLAPVGAQTDFVDVSIIPLSAIDRVEVLTDGASALYGADAIAGVVNFVLRKDFEGAETAVRQSGATRGGAEHFTASQLAGTSWSSGGGMVVLDFDSQNGLLSHDRNFIPDALTSVSLLPESQSRSIFSTVHQEIFGVSASMDVFYSERTVSAVSGGGDATSTNFIQSDGDFKNYGGALALSRKLGDDWQVVLTGAYTKGRARQRDDFASTASPDPLFSSTSTTISSIAQADIQGDGPLFAIREQTIRLALGIGHRTEQTFTPFSEFEVGSSLKRDVESVYSELHVPMIGGKNATRLAKRLELTVAARLDRYRDVGSSTNPKFALLWTPAQGINLRGTYATSYRVPLLDQLVFRPGYRVDNLPDSAASDGRTLTLSNRSAGPGLRPEESVTISAGIDIRPVAIPAFSLAATYFKTRFTNRLALAPLLGGLNNLYSQESVLGSLIDRSPDLVELQHIFAQPGWVANPGVAPDGAASIEATFDFRVLNLAANRESGVDISASYALPAGRGELSFNASGTYMLELAHQTLFTTPWVDFVNKIGQPMDLRLRGGLSWSAAGFSSSLNANYYSGYENNLFTPPHSIESWMTADVHISYRWEEEVAFKLLRGAKVSFSASNVTDEDPPFVESPLTFVGLDGGYDAANASPVGRVVAIRLSKQW